MRHLSSLWRSLSGPHPRVQPGDRHAARLIAQLTIIQAALIVVFVFLTNLLWKSMSGQSIWRDRDNWVVLAGLLLILVAFALVRAGMYRPGFWLYLLATAAVPLLAPFMQTRTRKSACWPRPSSPCCWPPLSCPNGGYWRFWAA